MKPSAPDPVAWATREVGLSPTAAPAEVRDGLLRDVTRADFVPLPLRQRAWQVLCTPPGLVPPCPPEVQLAEETRLRGEVDDFAASFFAIPIRARNERWQALSAECAFSPPLAARLAALERGLTLDVRPGDFGNLRTAQLASHVAGLFVLPPAARAAQRQAVLRGMQSDIAVWEGIARQLQGAAPALAALEPTLLTAILSWREQQRRLARVREARQPPGRPQIAPPGTRRPAPVSTASGSSNAGAKGVGCGAVFVVVMVVRACAGLGSQSSTPSYTPPPEIKIQQWNPPPPINVRQEDPNVADPVGPKRDDRSGRPRLDTRKP